MVVVVLNVNEMYCVWKVLCGPTRWEIPRLYNLNNSPYQKTPQMGTLPGKNISCSICELIWQMNPMWHQIIGVLSSSNTLGNILLDQLLLVFLAILYWFLLQSPVFLTTFETLVFPKAPLDANSLPSVVYFSTHHLKVT